MTAPSDWVPDADLLAAVAEALYDPYGRQYRDRAADARAALAAAGRVLAERLEQQADTDEANADAAGMPHTPVRVPGLRSAAGLVRAACGVPEGADGWAP